MYRSLYIDSMRGLRSFFIITLLFVMSIHPRAGRADDDLLTQVVSPPHAPVFIQRCRLQQRALLLNSVSVQNLTSHALLTMTVRLTFYDADHAVFAQTTAQYVPETPVAPGDEKFLTNDIFPSASEPISATAYVTCRIDAATFSGLKSWHYGQQWSGPLSKPDSGSGGPPGTGGGAAAQVVVHVLNTWIDPAPAYQTGFYIHDRVSISGTDRDANITSRGFTLRVQLANGGTQNLSGLSTAAPQYSKVNYATKQTIFVPEVSPNEDLGALGSLNVPAHGNATIVVTFFASAAVNQSSIGNVLYTSP